MILECYFYQNFLSTSPLLPSLSGCKIQPCKSLELSVKILQKKSTRFVHIYICLFSHVICMIVDLAHATISKTRMVVP